MKFMTASQPSRWPLLIALAMMCALRASLAQDYVVDHFDSDAEAGNWIHWWGASTWTAEFDPAVDAKSNANSGSLKVVVDFDGATLGGDNQFSFRRDLDSVQDGTKFTSLAMDIRFDPSSVKRKSGDFGYFEYGSRLPDYTQDYFGHINVPVTNGWIHLETPIPVSDKGIDTIAGITFKMWMGPDVTGTTTFWVDNIRLVASTNTPPPPPPHLALHRANPGLQLMASKPSSQYQRQSIRTATSEFSWVGNSQPVTYSITLTNYPGPTNSGFQTHLFLVPGQSIPNWETSPDWNEPSVIFLQIVNNQDGTAAARLMYKTNEPNGNTMIWGPTGTLARIQSPQILGTWSLTLKDSNIILTAPSGASTNGVIPSDALSLFADPLYAYFGVQPNSLGNIGQSATFRAVTITGKNNSLTDDFSSAQLDTNKWEIAAEDAGGIIPVPPTNLFWISWTLPATGFSLQTSPTLKPSSWIEPAWGTNALTAAGRKMVLFPSTNAPAGDKLFFRLLKP